MLKWTSILSVLILGVVFALWDMSSAPDGIRVTATQQSDDKAAPEFFFTDLKGKEYDLKQFKGKTILINFWATWCPPCIAEMPDLLSLAKREQDHLIFIAFSVDEETRAIEKFLDKLPPDAQDNLKLENVIFAHDADKTISKDLFGSTLYPESYIIKDGRIVQKIQGAIDWLGADAPAQLSGKN